MALIKFGGGVVQMTGSIAGNTFARNRYGNYARARTKPTNPNTARQQTVRGNLATLTTRWAQTLTAVQRTAWNLYGSNVVMTNKLGESMNLSGYNHYLRSNSILLDMGQTLVDAGPVVFELPGQDGTISLAGSEGTQKFATTFDDTLPWASETGAFMYAIQGAPQNPQRNFFAGPFRGMRFLTGDTGAPLTSPQDLVALLAITELQRVWWQFRIIRADGRLSQPFRADDFIAA